MPPARRWIDHPVFAAPGCTGIRSRLGISPNHPSFRVGVLRTHLLTALFAHAASGHAGVSASVAIRWDDTNQTRARPEYMTALLTEIREIAQVPLMPALRPLQQSARQHRYRWALAVLDDSGVIVRQGGVPCLSWSAVDDFITARGCNPHRLAADAVVNASTVPADHPEPLMPLARADGTALWHLASVVDDIDLDINLVVRGSDKINAVAVQERLRWVLSDGRQRAACLFVPRLVEPDGRRCRVSELMGSAIRPSALRWFLAEPYLRPDSVKPPETFTDLAARLRASLSRLRDATFDRNRLVALDRKISGMLATDVAASELRAVVGEALPHITSLVSRLHRRPLLEQVRLHTALAGSAVEFEPIPPRVRDGIGWLQAWLASRAVEPSPPSARWVLTGQVYGPDVHALLAVMPRNLIRQRVADAVRVTRESPQ